LARRRPRCIQLGLVILKASCFYREAAGVDDLKQG
jgi:hypothetical protein